MFSRSLLSTKHFVWHCRKLGFIIPKKYKVTTEDAPGNPRNCIIHTKSEHWPSQWNLETLDITQR